MLAEGFDRIVIAVPDLADAVSQYTALLGALPLQTPPVPDARARWHLGNTVLEVREQAGAPAGIDAIVLRCADAPVNATPLENSLGVDVQVCDGSFVAGLVAAHEQARSPLRVDHLVMRSRDADACIALFANQLGLRLALDQHVPEWGGRMLFFRAGKLTLEVIAPDAADVENTLWGIAFSHPDLDVYLQTLAWHSVATGAQREGRKPGTRVASVKSHALGIPTLLIEPPASSPVAGRR